MANTQQAKKRAKQSEKRRQHNVGQRSALRTSIKKVLKTIQAGDKTAATESYQSLTSLTDKSVNKNLIHANKAARIKSRMSNKLKAM